MNISLGGWPPTLEYHTNMRFQLLEFNLEKLQNSQNAQILVQTDLFRKNLKCFTTQDRFHFPYHLFATKIDDPIGVR